MLKKYPAPHIIFVIHIGLIVVDLEYVATSLCSLLSNTGFFASFFPEFT